MHVRLCIASVFIESYRAYMRASIDKPLLINYIRNRGLDMKSLILNGTEVRLGIDKTVLGLKYPSATNEQLKEMTDDSKAKLKLTQKQFIAKKLYIQNVIKSACVFSKKSVNHYLTRYFIKSESDNTDVCEIYLGQAGTTHIINIKFNPSKLSMDGKAEFDGLLAVTFNDHFEEVYSNSVVSHIEFFIDVLDIDQDDYVIVDLSRRTATNYKETRYQGKRTSPLSLAYYNKGKQLNVDDSITRIEARIERRDIKFQDLVESDLYNPFQQFIVISKKNLQLIALDKGCPKIADKIIEFGLFKAIKNPLARKSFATLIREHRAPWWDIHVFWQTHRELLQGLKPQNFLK